MTEKMHSFSFSTYFKGRNFRGQKLSRFSRFWPIFAKVYAFGNFKTAKRESFFTEKKLFFQANLRPLPEIRCYRKNQRHMDGYY